MATSPRAGAPRASAKSKATEPAAPVAPDTESAEAAQDEVDAEGDENAKITVAFQGKDYTFVRAAVRSPQFRRYWGKGQDVMGMELLLGEDQFDALLENTAGPDGFTPAGTFTDFVSAVGDALQVPNS